MSYHKVFPKIGKIQREIIELLYKESPLRVEEIAERLGRRASQINRSAGLLADRGILIDVLGPGHKWLGLKVDEGEPVEITPRGYKRITLDG